MRIEIQNIVFVNPTGPAINTLRAVFDVIIEDLIRINGFRYFDTTETVQEPAIKTERGYVRPVKATGPTLDKIHAEFIAAWDLLTGRKLV